MRSEDLPSPRIGARGHLLRSACVAALSQLQMSADGYGGKHPAAAELSAFFAACTASLGGLLPGGTPTPAPAPSGKILMVGSVGNSRSIGRNTPQTGDVWPSNCYEVKQGATTPVPCTGTMLDVGDQSGQTSSNMLSIWLKFAQEVNAAEPGVYEKIIFVADGESSTGVTDGANVPSAGIWAGGVPGNRLAQHIARWNTAYTNVAAANPGKQIDVLRHFGAANPDAGVNAGYLEPALGAMRADIAGSAGSANAAFIMLGGQTPDEATFSSDENHIHNNMVFATAAESYDYGIAIPVTYDRFGVGGTWPLNTDDGIHPNYRSDGLRAKAYYKGMKAAWAKGAWKAKALENVPAQSKLAAYYNFAYGLREIVSNDSAKSLVVTGSNPIVRASPTLSRYTLQVSATSSSNRTLKFPTTLTPPTGSYTKVIIFKQTALAAAMSFLGDPTASVAAGQHRFQYSAASTAIQIGNGSGSQLSYPSSEFSLTTFGVYAIVYDQAAGTLRHFVNGVQKGATITGVSALDATATWGALGGTTSGGSLAKGMEAVAVALYNGVPADAEIQAWNPVAVAMGITPGVTG